MTDLRERLARKDVVVLVGAGVAMATVDGQTVDGYPVAGWTGLLEHGIASAPDTDDDWRDLRHRQLGRGELISVAGEITDQFGGQDAGEFKRWLRGSVGALQPTRPDLITALHGLGAPLVTTNYDGLIEKVTGLRSLTWEDGSDWQELTRGGEPAVWHLHGHYQRPSSVILGVRAYARIENDEKAQAMLKALALTSTFLLVGFGDGLDDPNFSAMRAWMRKVAPDSTYRHYRLVTSGEREAAQQLHHSTERIVPLVYGDDRSQLEPFLRALGGAREGGGAPVRRREPQRVLEIHIARAGVEAKALTSEVVAYEPLGLDGLRLSMVQTLEEWLRLREDVEPGEDSPNGGEFDEADLLGRILYESVLYGQVKALFDQELAATAQGQRLAVVLRIARDMVTLLDEKSHMSLTSLPWELLRGPEGSLAVDGRLMLFRALPASSAAVPRLPVAAEPLRILVVPAQPSDVLEAARSGWSPEKKGRYDKALENIHDSLQALEEHDAVERVDVLERPTSASLKAALRTAQPPNIVHYIGYDSKNRDSQNRCIALLRPGGELAEWADNKQFADQFRSLSAPPRLVFLHLCEGPRDGYQNGYDFVRANFTELAQRLLDRGVQLVVAMQYPMSPDVGAEFTRRFYDRIREGESVAEAVQAARQDAAWFYRLGGPLLYLRDADETLIPREDQELVPASPATEAPRPVPRQDGQVPAAKRNGNGGAASPAADAPRPAVRPATQRPDASLSLAVFGLLAENVARAAGADVGEFVAAADELAEPLATGPGGQLAPARVRTELRGRVTDDADPGHAQLWLMLEDKLIRHVDASGGGSQ